MSKGLLDPKVDFVFKNIFGSPNHPEILISFLNATLKPKRKIVNVAIKKTDIEKQYIEDKYSRLDVKATTSDEKDMLVAWTEFLKDPESEKVRGLELSIDEIRQAKDELIRMSNDSTQRELYDMRANSLRDKISELNAVERKGREEEKLSIARNLLDILDNETIALKTGLTITDVEKLRLK